MDCLTTRTTCHPPLQSLLNNILGEKTEFGDEIKVKNFFFFRDRHDFGDEIEVKTFFFFRDHCDGERKNGESKHSQEWNF